MDTEPCAGSADIAHPAVSRLRAFFAAMSEWEWEGIVKFDDLRLGRIKTELEWEEWGTIWRARLAAIFEEYCEVGAKAKRLSYGMHCGGEDPIYDPDREKVLLVTVTPSKVVVETQMTHDRRAKMRYEMVEVEGKWKVRDNRKAMQDFQTKWHSHDL